MIFLKELLDLRLCQTLNDSVCSTASRDFCVGELRNELFPMDFIVEMQRRVLSERTEFEVVFKNLLKGNFPPCACTLSFERHSNPG